VLGEDGGRKFGFEFISFGVNEPPERKSRLIPGLTRVIEQFARTKAAYIIVWFLLEYDQIECTRVPSDAPLRSRIEVEAMFR
jgi:hypothetical protein